MGQAPGIAFLQAPARIDSLPNAINPPRTFAHVLHNCGFGDRDELLGLVSAWRDLFDRVKPDVIVFEHAPAALLAARGRDIRRVVLGNGFCCPPDCTPLPDLRPWMPPEPERLRRDERRVLDCMNHVLEQAGVEPLERISQIYGEVDETLLVTLAEFDHYPARQALTPCPSAVPREESTDALTPCPSPGGRGEIWYHGPWCLPGGEKPIWPDGKGKQIYAYLNRFPARDQLLARLAELGCPTIVSLAGADEQAARRFSAANLRFESRHLDMRQVAAECDLAILNGNHGTTIAMLLAGKPVLQIPTVLEQAHNAQATARLRRRAGLFQFASRGDSR